MRKSIIVALVAALALVAFGCSSGDDDEAASGAGSLAEEKAAPSLAGRRRRGRGDRAALSGRGSLPAIQPSIVQTASLSLSVPRNEFDQTIERACMIATGAGGFVVSSSCLPGRRAAPRERLLVVGSWRAPTRGCLDCSRSSDVSRPGRRRARTSPRSSSTFRPASATSKRSRPACSASSSRRTPLPRRSPSRPS